MPSLDDISLGRRKDRVQGRARIKKAGYVKLISQMFDLFFSSNFIFL